MGEAVGSWISDKECVQLAMCCATREPNELLELLFNRDVERASKAAAKAVAITAEEFEALFGVKARATREGSIAAVLSEQTFARDSERLGSALRGTVAETAQGAALARPWTPVSAHYAMPLHAHEESVAATLGSVVRADTRRLDDFRAELEDAGIDAMLMGSVVVALSETVT